MNIITYFKKNIFFLITLAIISEFLWSISYYNTMTHSIVNGTNVPSNVWVVLFGTGLFMVFGAKLLEFFEW